MDKPPSAEHGLEWLIDAFYNARGLAVASCVAVLACARYLRAIPGYLVAMWKGGILILRSFISIAKCVDQIITVIPKLIVLPQSMEDLRSKFDQDSHHNRAVTALMLKQLSLLTTAQALGIHECDTKGMCAAVNDVWTNFTGLTLDQAKGQGWLNAVHSDDRERVTLAWDTALLHERQFESTFRYVHAITKESTVVTCRAIAITDQTTQQLLSLMVISQRTTIEEAPYQVLIVDDDAGFIASSNALLRGTSVNPLHVSTLGAAREALNGRHFDAIAIDLHLASSAPSETVQSIPYFRRYTRRLLIITGLSSRQDVELLDNTDQVNAIGLKPELTTRHDWVKFLVGKSTDI